MSERYNKSVYVKLIGDKDEASHFISAARAALGVGESLNNSLGNDEFIYKKELGEGVSCVTHRTLNGDRIVYITAGGGGRIWVLVFSPVNHSTAPNGWGAPFDDSSYPLGSFMSSSTEDHRHKLAEFPFISYDKKVIAATKYTYIYGQYMYNFETPVFFGNTYWTDMEKSTIHYWTGTGIGNSEYTGMEYRDPEGSGALDMAAAKPGDIGTIVWYDSGIRQRYIIHRTSSTSSYTNLSDICRKIYVDGVAVTLVGFHANIYTGDYFLCGAALFKGWIIYIETNMVYEYPYGMPRYVHALNPVTNQHRELGKIGGTSYSPSDQSFNPSNIRFSADGASFMMIGNAGGAKRVTHGTINVDDQGAPISVGEHYASYAKAISAYGYTYPVDGEQEQAVYRHGSRPPSATNTTYEVLDGYIQDSIFLGLIGLPSSPPPGYEPPTDNTLFYNHVLVSINGITKTYVENIDGTGLDIENPIDIVVNDEEDEDFHILDSFEDMLRLLNVGNAQNLPYCKNSVHIPKVGLAFGLSFPLDTTVRKPINKPAATSRSYFVDMAGNLHDLGAYLLKEDVNGAGSMTAYLKPL